MTKISNMPFDVYQLMQAQKLGQPVVYPNSENVAPPINKERKRVVEAATRTEVRLSSLRSIEDRIQEIYDLEQQAKLRYTRSLSYQGPDLSGSILDIEV